MKTPMPEKVNRTFSKRLVVLNIVLTWALMFASIIWQQAEYVIGAGLTLIGTLFGIYAGIGHLDFRKSVELTIDQLVKGSDRK